MKDLKKVIRTALKTSHRNSVSFVKVKKMYRSIFLLVFLFAWILCEIVIIKKQKDKLYTGHILFEQAMTMWSACAQFCSRVKVCKSINFISSNKSCQIFDAEPEESNYHGKLIESTGNSFVAASTFPKVCKI